jgi:lipopolysaccharide export system permease protein
MNLFGRYMLKSLAVAMFFVTITVSSAVWLTQSIHFLQLAVGGGAPFSIFLELVMLSLPNFVSIVLPIAMLSIILFVYNRMISESEMVVMRAAGTHTWVLAKPAILLGIAMAILVFIMNGWVGPVSNRTMKQVRNQAQSEYTNILLHEGVFTTIGTLTIFVRDRDPKGDMLGLTIEDDKDPKAPRTIVAKRGVMVDSETGPRLIVYQGERQELDHQTQHLSRLSFDDYTIDLTYLDSTENERWLDPGDRTLTQLLTPTNDPRDKGYENYFIAEANARIASPLFILDFTFIGLACLLVGEFDRRGQAKRILKAIVIAVAVQATSIGLSNLSRTHMGAVPFIYVAGIVPLLVCYLYIKRRSETLRPLRWGRLIRLPGQG